VRAVEGQWIPVARSDEVDTTPRAVRVGGRDFVAVRLSADTPATLVAAVCPHRLVPLDAATVAGGRLRCAYHGWEFDTSGACVRLPSLGDDAHIPPRSRLAPARTRVHAGFVADNFLDVAHFPFVHRGTFGAGADEVVPAADVQPEPGGFRSVQEQWFDNPEDPGVAAGLRPVRQRRRSTYVYRAPFQLLLRLEELDASSVKTILFFSQPESATSTRIYTKMLLHAIGGEAMPGPETLAREVAFEEAVLAEDVALQDVVRTTGLPLDMCTELHVRADRLGVALRRELARFVERAGS
jgi:phenylpropionate dioxygenase-like ring-hydroxylating dioxygenase large terminal subunit